MALENKLGIETAAELARAEERISKTKALELFETGLLDTFSIGTFAGLARIHGFLFSELYDFSDKIREVNITKGNFRFVPLMYLEAALKHIDEMPQSTFDDREVYMKGIDASYHYEGYNTCKVEDIDGSN